MKKVLILLFVLLMALPVLAQTTYYTRIVNTSLPGEIPVGTPVRFTASIRQGLGFEGVKDGVVTGYQFTSFANQQPAHLSGEFVRAEWDTRQYVVTFNPVCDAWKCFSNQAAVDSVEIIPTPTLPIAWGGSEQTITQSLQSDHKALCNEHPEYYATLGPECVNPVPYNLPGFVPVGTRVTFGTPGGQVLTGRVTGYYWHLTARAYLYTVEQDGTVNPVIGWIAWPVTVTVMNTAAFVVWVSVEL